MYVCIFSFPKHICTLTYRNVWAYMLTSHIYICRGSRFASLLLAQAIDIGKNNSSAVNQLEELNNPTSSEQSFTPTTLRPLHTVVGQFIRNTKSQLILSSISLACASFANSSLGYSHQNSTKTTSKLFFSSKILQKKIFFGRKNFDKSFVFHGTVVQKNLMFERVR